MKTLRLDSQRSVATSRRWVATQEAIDASMTAEIPEGVLSEVSTDPQPKAQILPWRGNVTAAAGVAILDMVARQG